MEEGAISKLEDRAIEIIQTEAYKENAAESNNGVSVTYGIFLDRSKELNKA